jgi:DNA-binding transcriptional LysR family regulator
VRQFSLVNQINRIERELGKKLLERAERGRPMRLTADGAAVVRAVMSYERKIGKQTPK